MRAARLAPAVLTVLLAAGAARGAAFEAPPEWNGYALSLAAPGNPVAAVLGANLDAPLVTPSLAAALSQNPALSPQALAAETPAAQAAVLLDAVRAQAAPVLAQASAGADPAAALTPERLVGLHALAGLLPSAERSAVVAGVNAAFARRGDSLTAAARRMGAALSADEAGQADDDAVGRPGAGSQAPRPSGLVRYDPSALAADHARAAVDDIPPAPDADDPFRAIVPKVSRASLLAKLESAPTGGKAQAKLGSGTEAYAGVYAVAERTPEGVDVYEEKHFDSPYFVQEGLPALALAERLKDRGELPGFDVIRVLASSPDSTIVRLSFAEGLDLGMIRHEAGAGKSAAYAEISQRYDRALKRTADALNAAGWKALLDEKSGSLYVYPRSQSGSAGVPRIAFQLLPQNVVATTDGRFVLIDPF